MLQYGIEKVGSSLRMPVDISALVEKLQGCRVKSLSEGDMADTTITFVASNSQIYTLLIDYRGLTLLEP